MNLLFLVAGYQHYEKLGDLTAEGLRIHFDINAIGPLLMVQALRQNLQAGTQVRHFQPAACQTGQPLHGVWDPHHWPHLFAMIWPQSKVLVLCKQGFLLQQD